MLGHPSGDATSRAQGNASRASCQPAVHSESPVAHQAWASNVGHMPFDTTFNVHRREAPMLLTVYYRGLHHHTCPVTSSVYGWCQTAPVVVQAPAKRFQCCGNCMALHHPRCPLTPKPLLVSQQQQQQQQRDPSAGFAIEGFQDGTASRSSW